MANEQQNIGVDFKLGQDGAITENGEPIGWLLPSAKISKKLTEMVSAEYGIKKHPLTVWEVDDLAKQCV